MLQLWKKNCTLLMQELQLKKTVVTFQFDVSGIHIVEEFGSATEWPNRDGRFDLSDFRKDTTLLVQGTQSHQSINQSIFIPPKIKRHILSYISS